MQEPSQSPWIKWAARLCFGAPAVVFVVSVYQMTSPPRHTEQRSAHSLSLKRSPQVGVSAPVPASTVREQRATSVSADGPSQALDAARLAFAASDPLMRAEAAADLASVGTDVVVPELMVAALHDRDARVREEAVHALAEIAIDDAVPTLAQALQDPDAEVRRTALAQLGEMESPAAERVLRVTAADSRHSMQVMAADVLADR
jgi:HEAT repeat protein